MPTTSEPTYGPSFTPTASEPTNLPTKMPSALCNNSKFVSILSVFVLCSWGEACVDYVPAEPEISVWVDALGQTCEDYAKNPVEMCTTMGNENANYGLTAIQACCACEGGDLCDRDCESIQSKNVLKFSIFITQNIILFSGHKGIKISGNVYNPVGKTIFIFIKLQNSMEDRQTFLIF